MRRTAVLCEGGVDCPGKASVRVTQNGRCELELEAEEKQISFPCSVSAMINVGLGARTHLASDFGSCTLSRMPGGVKITMTPWGYTPVDYLVPLDTYADALTTLSDVDLIRGQVSLR